MRSAGAAKPVLSQPRTQWDLRTSSDPRPGSANPAPRLRPRSGRRTATLTGRAAMPDSAERVNFRCSDAIPTSTVHTALASLRSTHASVQGKHRNT